MKILGVFRNIAKMWFLIFMTLVAFLAIASIFYSSHTRFRSTDPKIELQSYVPRKSGPESKSIAIVETGLFVKGFSEFSFVENSFIADVVVWFLFKPHEIPKETIDAFSFEGGEIKSKSAPEIKIIEDKIFTRYLVRVEFKANLNYELFPLDDHRLCLILINRDVIPQEVRFVSDDSSFGVVKNLYTNDWKFDGKQVLYGVMASVLDEDNSTKNIETPAVVFSLDFSKLGVRKIFVLFVPLFLVFFMGLFSLAVEVDKWIEMSLSMSIGSITAMLFYRFVIEKMSPNVGYFTIADKIYTFLVITAFLIFLSNVYTAYYFKRKKHIGTKEEEIKKLYRKLMLFKKSVYLTLIPIVVLVTYIFIFFV
jgi:hypothetical protein